MSNKYHNRDTVTSRQSGGEGGQMKAQGKGGASAGRQGTAAWPGVPGKTQKSRAGGAPTSGFAGPFHVKKEGI